MKRAGFHSLRVIALAAVATFVIGRGEVGAAPSRQEQAQRLVFLLQYVGADYPAAVRDGEVINDLEYGEMLDFSAAATERLSGLREGLAPDVYGRAEASLSRLRSLIRERAAPAAIRKVTDEVIPMLVDAFDLKPVPRQAPRIEHAAALYQENCAVCHGERGDGNGPRADELDPPPASFLDAERMESTAPYVFYNAITFGVDGTGMASFREGLDDQERWDLAFFLWTFLAPDRPAGARPDTGLTLRDLASRSTAELAREIMPRATGLSAGEAKALVTRLRVDPPPVTDFAERLARVEDDLREGLALLESGDPAGAAEHVTAAYLDDFEPLEPELDRRNPVVRQRFERGLIDFRAALRAGDGAKARKVGGDLLETTRVAQRLFGPTGEQSRVGTWLVLGGVAVLLAGGMAVMALRRS